MEGVIKNSRRKTETFRNKRKKKTKTNVREVGRRSTSSGMLNEGIKGRHEGSIQRNGKLLKEIKGGKCLIQEERETCDGWRSQEMREEDMEQQYKVN